MGRSFKVPAHKVRLHHHNDFYDHPLTGVCIVNGKWWRFDRDYRSNQMTIFEMTAREKLTEWWGWAKFYVMVGSHTTYRTDRMRQSWYGHRKPRWLHRRLSSAYYYGWRGIVSPRM